MNPDIECIRTANNCSIDSRIGNMQIKIEAILIKEVRIKINNIISLYKCDCVILANFHLKCKYNI